MPYISTWREAESKVYQPGLWLPFVAGTFFFVFGGGIAFLIKVGGIKAAPGVPPWCLWLFPGVLIPVGGALLAWVIRTIWWPTYVRQAAPDVLPNVPKEPVIYEGAMVDSRLTHELCENAEGWELRPAETLWRSNRFFLPGFGIPFLIGFSGILTWVLHSEMHSAGWLVSAACATIVTAACGGFVVVLIAMGLRSGYRHLAKLTIPRGGNSLELELAEAPDWQKADLAEGLKWWFLADTKRQRLSIPLEKVVAVQLCPWEVAVLMPRRRSTMWAVQGLIVLSASESAVYHRLPVLLTGDFVGAARLMQRLAHILQVPYLFCADAAGWKAEEMRAKNRPPLGVGGWQT